jgi:hypothetical protein
MERKIAATRLSALNAAPVERQVIRAGEPIPDPTHLPVEGAPAYPNEVKDPKDHQTIADKLTYLCDALEARHDRTTLPDGRVVLRVHLASGDTFAGTGENTAAAFDALLAKCQAFANAPEPDVNETQTASAGAAE